MMFQPPRLGPGAIYLRSLDALFRSHADLIKVAEIEPQTLWTKGTAPGSMPRGSPGELRHVASLPQVFLTHGVGSPIGGTLCDQDRHVPQFLAWNEALRAPWTSEHLSILDVRAAREAQPCGFLMPPLQTEAGAGLAASNIRNRAAALGKPFAFETGVNYFAPRAYEMPDGEFFAAVADAADCGILLDLTNLWANHKNGRARIEQVIAQLPLERVWEVHLAGLEFAHGHWLDAHAKGIDEDLLEIAADVVAELPNLGAILFEIAPDRLGTFHETEFLREMETVNRLWEVAGSRPKPANISPQSYAAPAGPSPEDWEWLIANQMLPAHDRPNGKRRGIEAGASEERSFALYRELAGSFRRGAVAELMEHSTRLLLLAMGEAELRSLMDRYMAVNAPVTFPTEEALSFKRFLEANPAGIPGLADLSNFEAAMICAAADGAAVQVEVARDMDAVLGEIAAERLPGPATERPRTVLEICVLPEPEIRVVR